MFGVTSPSLFVMALSSVLALFLDLKYRKLFNWFTIPLLMAGLLFSALSHGLPGVISSSQGVAVAFGLFAWMFWLRFLGGGDVKYMMALGSWGGPQFIFQVAILSVVIAGLLALMALTWRGLILDWAKHVYAFLLSLWVPGLKPHYVPLDESVRIPFGVPTALAVLGWVYSSGGIFSWI